MARIAKPALPENVNEIMTGLFEGSTEDSPIDLNDLRAFTKLGIREAVSLFVDMQEAKLIETAGRGENMVGWVAGETKAEMEAARAKERERLEYATRAAETQDEIMSQAEPPASETATGLTRAEIKAELPSVKLEIIEPEEVVTPDAREALSKLYEETLKARDEASNVREGYEIPAEVTELPSLPLGVSENVWNAAHNAFSVSERDTLSARLFYIGKALDQHVDALA